MHREKSYKWRRAYAEVSAVKEVDRPAEVSVPVACMPLADVKCDLGRVFSQGEIAI